ncbi:MAG TPA: ATP-binding protein [Prolixibacteraceae bacterium]|nr:ATP-binding protein [Prolixibacteraceae bacterium]
MKNRHIKDLIITKEKSKTGRIIIFTGARQTGKTTLSRLSFPDYHYISVEDPIMRGEYTRLTSGQWKQQHPKAILDEVQKEPVLIESIKSVYDQWEEPRYILLGSSQFLLLEKVRESLAGRCSVFELFPLTLPELKTRSFSDPIKNSIFQQILQHGVSTSFLPSFLLDPEHTEKSAAWEHYQKYGGYPALTDDSFSEKDRFDWLYNYTLTYLERDIRDLANFRELEPFIKLQRYLAMHTGQLINASAISRQLGVTSKTVQRYIRYLELSYQSITLSPWSRNPGKRLVKTPKIHFLDQGIVQTIVQKRGGITGNEFESLVISEIYKQVRNIEIRSPFYHLRTSDGREVDLLIELPEGYLAFEIKIAWKVDRQDIRHFKELETILDKPLIHCFLLSNDPVVYNFEEKITGIHAAHFLG